MKANTRALTRLLVILLPANVALTVTVGLLTGDAEMNRYLFYVLPVYGFVAFFAGAVVAKLVKDGARVRLSLRAAVVLALFAYLVVWFCSRRVPVLGHGAETRSCCRASSHSSPLRRLRTSVGSAVS